MRAQLYRCRWGSCKSAASAPSSPAPAAGLLPAPPPRPPRPPRPPHLSFQSRLSAVAGLCCVQLGRGVSTLGFFAEDCFWEAAFLLFLLSCPSISVSSISTRSLNPCRRGWTGSTPPHVFPILVRQSEDGRRINNLCLYVVGEAEGLEVEPTLSQAAAQGLLEVLVHPVGRVLLQRAAALVEIAKFKNHQRIYRKYWFDF